MATLKEIAHRAGVTTATVSRALRDMGNVHPLTAERVRAAARELGYRPNPRISSLMSLVRTSNRRTFRENLALVWMDATAAQVRANHHLAQYEEGVCHRAASLGFGIDVFYPRENGPGARALLRVLSARGVRGIVFGPVLRSSRFHLRLAVDEFAVTAIGEAFVAPRLSHARSDLFVGMREALHRIKRRGCRRIGLVIDAVANRRALPFLTAAFLACAPLPLRERDDIHAPLLLDPEETREWAMRRQLDALLLSNDMTDFAPPFLTRSRRALPVFSLNRLTEDSVFSGIDQQQAHVGAKACDMVIAQLLRLEKGVPEHPVTLLIEGIWREALSAASGG